MILIGKDKEEEGFFRDNEWVMANLPNFGANNNNAIYNQRHYHMYTEVTSNLERSKGLIIIRTSPICWIHPINYVARI